ncbi:MAG TPA: enoyl-CoA hydratase [Acidimicrobiales bacterium]|nr:enoyl-CoA hydratase [Acidimicrobiales bacterium]
MDTLIVERSEGVVTVTLNRPEKKNAVDMALWRHLQDTFREIADRSDDRVVILTGAGGAFCSGADLGDPETATMHGLPRMRLIDSVAIALHRLPQPTIAKVTGVAAGAGCNMAFGCDLVVASDQARFSEIFSLRGLSIDFGGSWLLPRLIGLHKAKELAFFADIVSAADAERIGVVNRVLPADEVDGFVADWAARLAAGPPLALAMTKSMLNNSMGPSFEQAIETEAYAQSVNFASADAAEAFRAFVEKRPPVFTGR